MKLNRKAIISAYKERFPDFEWDKFFEIDRALNAELWYGPLPTGYWSEVDPLEYYEWVNFQQGMEDLRDMLTSIPGEMYWDNDFEGLLNNNPYNDEGNWQSSEDCEDEMDYLGPWEYFKINTDQELLSKEVWKII